MNTAQAFQAERPRLVGLAYRMLGRVSVAEEVVQEAGLRASQAEAIERPEAWLTTVVTRLCLDELRSARARRERYFGPWLPEPLISEGPEPRPELAASMHPAFLLLLEKLSGPQRAAFLLREVFDEDYAEIGEVLGTSPENTRQLVARARRHLAGAPRYDADLGLHAALLARFSEAVRTGDLSGLKELLREDVVVMTDGGGRVRASGVVITGPARVAKAIVGFGRLLPADLSFRPAFINGLPGALLLSGGAVYATVTLGLVDGRVAGYWSVMNPEKLAHLAHLA
ncbi:MAG: RNA polymerase sigma factor SigJ [Alphaproteobacteria bacterium]|nr:RNA polymerase sigma factor SigJ [Alphaproteobacteria bacterium]MCB9796066.1 RNA polymerase sigma factor SigJ [Alphaproteobacteria bacterium]